MKTVGEILKLSAAYLEERKVGQSRRIVEDLMAHILRLKRIDLYMQFDRPMVESELVLLRELLKRSAKQEPLEYITGKVEFFGCTIRVDRRVLIPRPETEILVEKIAKEVREGVVWDLCTGSGCVGIALKKAIPELKVSISDLSEAALALAAENMKLNGVDVEIRQGDLLAPFAGRKADVIVCNPPYISEKEYLGLDPSVREFEPKKALVGGERGTEFFERLSIDLPHFLNEKGKVYLEMGADQGEAVRKIFSKDPWKEGQLLLDWAGHDRFFFLEKQ